MDIKLLGVATATSMIISVFIKIGIIMGLGNYIFVIPYLCMGIFAHVQNFSFEKKWKLIGVETTTIVITIIIVSGGMISSFLISLVLSYVFMHMDKYYMNNKIWKSKPI